MSVRERRDPRTMTLTSDLGSDGIPRVDGADVFRPVFYLYYSFKVY